jgi:hypothetical protein
MFPQEMDILEDLSALQTHIASARRRTRHVRNRSQLSPTLLFVIAFHVIPQSGAAVAAKSLVTAI